MALLRRLGLASPLECYFPDRRSLANGTTVAPEYHSTRLLLTLLALSARCLAGTRLSARFPRGEFAHLVLLMAIAIHMANYFWSFEAKAALPHSPGSLPGASWLLENNPAYIYLSALDNDHIFFSGYPTLVEFLYRLVDSAHLLSNVWVLGAQAPRSLPFFCQNVHCLSYYCCLT